MPLLPLQGRCLISLARLVADEHQQRALLVTESDPKREYAHNAPYVVLYSEADPWERANAASVVDPARREES